MFARAPARYPAVLSREYMPVFSRPTTCVSSVRFMKLSGADSGESTRDHNRRHGSEATRSHVWRLLLMLLLLLAFFLTPTGGGPARCRASAVVQPFCHGGGFGTLFLHRRRGQPGGLRVPTAGRSAALRLPRVLCLLRRRYVVRNLVEVTFLVAYFHIDASCRACFATCWLLCAYPGFFAPAALASRRRRIRGGGVIFGDGEHTGKKFDLYCGCRIFMQQGLFLVGTVACDVKWCRSSARG